jgi:hypothetical protein
MHHFAYRDGFLHAEDVDLRTVADQGGTPFYCYSTATIERHFRVLTEAFAGQDHLVCFAVKANSNQAVLATLARLGAGMDVVSEGELRRALAAGVPANRIIFAGVGKTREEMAYALKQGILGFNVESAPELQQLSEVASGLGVTAAIAIRVNPDVDAKTHAKISTGKSENKFGVPFLEAPGLYDRARTLPGIAISGIHMHIGSQITELGPFRDAFALMREMVLDLRSRGIALKHLDIGGGLGVPYRADNEWPPHPDEYARVRADPKLVRNAFDESLRWDSPSRMAGRITTRDVEIEDHVIPAGTRCGLMFAAANRDPRFWERPDAYDAGRDLRHSLGFGYGVHACVGRTLALIEASALLGAIVREVESIEIAGDYEPWMTTVGHGPIHQLVRLKFN